MTNLKSIAQKDLTRGSVVWFSIAFILTMIPQLFLFLPMWVAALFIICFIWRIQIFRMRIGYPHWVVKAILILAIIGLLFISKGNFLNTEGCSILFMAVYALKFVESKTIHDGHILGCVGFIALASIYLFDNSAYTFSFSLLILITLITAMIGLQQVGYGIYSRRHLLFNALRIIGISLPLMALLFVIFPRFPSMLPSRGESQPQAQTGVSNTMEPGSIAELANSDKHIFWAEFTDYVPMQKDLYWRSLTLDQYDGRAWRQSDSALLSIPANYEIKSDIGKQDYTIIFDPSFQKYLATLDLSLLNSQSSRGMFFPYGDFRIEYGQPIDMRIQYTMSYYPSYKLLNRQDQGRFRERSLNQFLQVTDNNPKTTAWVNEVLTSSSSRSEVVNKILKHFREDGYSYTMNPGLLRQVDSIDEFMFEQKRGFCEHYASATAFMLRQAGIPSRVVIGYLGGDVSQERKLVDVRGKDAHAWVEYWDDDKGWIRIDPTAAVAPDRIELGIDDMISSMIGESVEEPSAWANLQGKFTNIKDMIDYRWAKVVLGYQNESQQSLLAKLFKVDFISIFTLAKISLVLVFAFATLQVTWFFKPWRYLLFNFNREYQKMIEFANSAYQLDLPISIAPTEFSEKISKYLPEKERDEVDAMSKVIVAYFYQPVNQSSVKSSKPVRKALFTVQKILKGKNGKRRN